MDKLGLHIEWAEQESRHAVILSTHILAEVEAICRRVILISEGRKTVDAPLADLTRDGHSLLELFARETSADPTGEPAATP